MNIAIAGGTGFVGKRLTEFLLQAGHTVGVLTRNPAQAQNRFAQLSAELSSRLTITAYDPHQEESWRTAIAGSNGIVNLVGESLTGERWTPRKKTEILNSRVDTTEKLVAAIASLDQKPEVLVNASAIGYYGPHEDEIVDESTPPANDFLSGVCKQWEAASGKVTDLGVRLVQVRIGIVLGADGGALGQMLGFFQMFIGGPIGSGKQWLSWVHRDDLVGAIAYSLEQSGVSGAVNLTAPNPVPMDEFCNTLGQVMARPSWLPVPSLALELIFGEAAQIILTGQRVMPARIQGFGYQFKFPQLRPALQDILLHH